jgi:predicted ATP-dependent protease
VEYAARTVDDQKKLSTRFSEILDLLWESHYWAEQASSSVVRAEDVQRAIDERRIRSNLTEERLQEFITDGIILVDIEGEKVGQINGLAVYDLGDYRFGKPSRITVETYMGEEGVINIERESKLSGRIHDKGVLILSGYLGGKYGSGRPMSVSASLCFEQSYEGIEGDSASSTELYALLSSLSGLPMRQGIAVTGSVNQKGEIQPIGGVNEKVEGFFDVCKAKGLTGDQGVLIPHQNIPHLMLRDDVVEAVAAGQFHVYPVSTVDGGIEVLTGTPAGKMEPDGNFTEGSVHDRVNRRFQELAEGLREFGRAGAPAPHAQEEEEEAAARSEDFPEDEPDLPAIIPDEEDEGF